MKQSNWNNGSSNPLSGLTVNMMREERGKSLVLLGLFNDACYAERVWRVFLLWKVRMRRRESWRGVHSFGRLPHCRLRMKKKECRKRDKVVQSGWFLDQNVGRDKEREGERKPCEWGKRLLLFSFDSLFSFIYCTKSNYIFRCIHI